MSAHQRLLTDSIAKSALYSAEIGSKQQIQDIYNHVATVNGMSTALNNSGYTDPQLVLVQEFQSDVLLSMISFSSGFERLSMMSLRSALESCVFFLYFIDHPHEYALWEIGAFEPKIKETNSKLRLYHSHLLSKDLNWWLDVLDTQYGLLSRSVHPSRDFMINDLSNPINIQNSTAHLVPQWAENARKITRSMICLLYVRFYSVFEGGRHFALKKQISDVITQGESQRLNSLGYIL